MLAMLLAFLCLVCMTIKHATDHFHVYLLLILHCAPLRQHSQHEVGGQLVKCWYPYRVHKSDTIQFH